MIILFERSQKVARNGRRKQKIDFSENRRFMLQKMGIAAYAEQIQAKGNFYLHPKTGFGKENLEKSQKVLSTVKKIKILTFPRAITFCVTRVLD